MKKISEVIENYKTLIFEIERFIWAHPETGYREFITSKYLAEQFEKLGYKLSAMFVIRPYEYNAQEYIYYENNKYKVERTYEKNTEELEIICSKIT